MTRLLRWGFSFACVFAVLASSGVMAQGVMDRSRPEYDAKGFPLGGFRLYTGVSVSATWDDNVHRRDSTVAQEDRYVTVTPTFNLQSQWSRHAFSLSGDLEHLSYSKLDSENQTNWNLNAGGRLDITRAIVIDGSTRYSVLHEPRSSPDLPGFAAEPTEYNVKHAQGRARFQPNRLGFTVGGSVDEYDYKDVPLVGGGTLDNDDRDRRQYEFYGVATYEFSPGYALLVRASYNNRDYDRLLDRSGVNRDSNGYRVQGGVQFLLTDLLEGEIYGGYLHQKYSAATLADVTGGDFGATLSWYVLPVLTVHFNANRSVSDTTLAGASGSVDTNVNLDIDYEFRRNIIVQAGAGYSHSEYEGLVREDDTITARLAVRYLLNRYLSAVGRYAHSRRDSSLAGQDYTDNLFTVGMSFHP